jgi:hypothetical protein
MTRPGFTRFRFTLKIDASTDALNMHPNELPEIMRAVAVWLEAFENREPGVIEFDVHDSHEEKVGVAILQTDREI